MKPKEDPADRAARLRERRMSQLEQGRTAEQSAGGLTSDLRSVYGFKNMPNLFTPGISAPKRPVSDLSNHYAKQR